MKYLNIDILAGLGAFAYTIAALFIVQLATLVHPGVSGAFALGALGRGYKKIADAEAAV